MNRFILFLLVGVSAILSYLVLNFQNFTATNIVILSESGFMLTVGAFLIVVVMCLAVGLLLALKS